MEFRRDIVAGLVVFLVALPLCLGVALASNAPPFAGLVAGIIGGILVGFASGSQTSVSGPAAGLAAVVAAQILSLGSFEAFLLAVMLAGFIQIGLGYLRMGFIAAFFPSSVIKGLLAAIGVLLILKQIPHVVGRDTDPVGEMAFQQPDKENTFSELLNTFDDLWQGDVAYGTVTIGISSLLLLYVWGKWKRLKHSPVPSSLVVVLFGVGANLLLRHFGIWVIEPSHLVQVDIANSPTEFFQLFKTPDFSQWSNRAIYIAAITIAIVASLETLLNLEAVDKIDPLQRTSPPNRELIAQGLGNIVAGLIGGLPVTSVIVRSSVNINAGNKSKASAIIHGALLLICVALLPHWLNLIPKSCLAAILIFTGYKLASPKLIREMTKAGYPQFVPFLVTVLAIVFTDLLIGVIIGLAISVGFILQSNFRRPIRCVVEKHLNNEVVRIELANTVSFLNRAALDRALNDVPSGGHVLIDAETTDYIDPDVLALIRDYTNVAAPTRSIAVSLVGFRTEYKLHNRTHYIDYSTRELQNELTPQQVLNILKDGYERFRSGENLTRDIHRQIRATASGQHPLAVILSCIDSRTPAEMIFDLGVGDILNVRIAGNVTTEEVIGSLEYSCAVAGAKLILVMGHTRCGAVGATVVWSRDTQKSQDQIVCEHLQGIVREIQHSNETAPQPDEVLAVYIDEVARRNVERTVLQICEQSQTLNRLKEEGRMNVVGAMYDVATGTIAFLP